MSLNEKVAYLKGLADGIGFDSEAKEGKLFCGIIDMLSSVSSEIELLSDRALELGEELDALSDSLADVEEILFDNDFKDDDDDYYDFGELGDFDDFDDFDDDDDDECDCEFCNGHDFSLEVDCPNCGANIELSEANLTSGKANCAACGEEFELEFDDEEGVEEEVPF